MSIYEASGKQACEKFTAFSQYHSAGGRPSGFERFFAEAAGAWAQPEPDMTRIAAIAEKTDFNPREVRGKRYLCAQLHRDIRGPAGTTFP